jgi:predicted MPP superfamily phosphohydrolase
VEPFYRLWYKPAVRRLIGAGLALGSAAGMGLLTYATQVEPYWLQIVRRDLILPGLPRELDGLTILHLSDLHARPGDRRSAGVVARAARLSADLVALTGDYGDVPAFADVAADLLRPLRAPLGIYAVFGNHDSDVAPRVWPHRYSRDTAVRVAALLEAQNGATALFDESIRLERGGAPLWVVGLDDPHTFYDDPVRAFRGVPDDEAAVVLAHSWEPALPLERRGATLVLCGHTHGGQVRMPFRDAPETNTHRRPTRAGGLFWLGPTAVHISHGLGGTRALRFLVRPQAVVFRMRSAGPSARSG